MAQTMDVGKLRQVLDYWSCETCLDSYTPEQDYFCGVCVRLNRDVRVKKNALGTDEAVQIIPPEDFTMAKDLRDRIQAQEVELQEARQRAEDLTKREADLQARLAALEQELEQAKTRKSDDELVDFSLVGVKREPKPEELLEFSEEAPEPGPAPATLGGGWEVVEEAPEGSPEESAPESMEPLEAVEEPAAQGQARLTPARKRQGAADDAIARIEAEISKIEEELTQLATKEKGLSRNAGSKRRRRGGRA